MISKLSSLRACLLLVIGLLFGSAGCSPSLVLSTLELDVRSAAKAVANAQVTFQNLDQDTPGSAFGITDESGKCIINYPEEGGLAPGKYKVEITVETLEDGSSIPAGEEGVVMRNSNQTVSITYEFAITLDPGENTSTLKLEDALRK